MAKETEDDRRARLRAEAALVERDDLQDLRSDMALIRAAMERMEATARRLTHPDAASRLEVLRSGQMTRTLTTLLDGLDRSAVVMIASYDREG